MCAPRTAGEEEERGDDGDGGEDAIEQVVNGDGKPEIDRLADAEGVVGGLGEQDEGEPEVFELSVADEEEAEDGESDEGGSHAVGVAIDKANVAGDLEVLLLDGE